MHLEEVIGKLEERGEKLRDHQVEGLRVIWEWHEKGKGGILADEMGLGKTCTAIVHLLRLRMEGLGPFLVLCPLSVLQHWQREIERFGCGELEAMSFEARGDELDLDTIHLDKKNVFLTPSHLVVTRHEKGMEKFLNRNDFSLIVVDESHRLKNVKSKLTVILHQIETEYLLLTGTPVQNNVSELFSLLSFCDFKRFPVDDLDVFISKYSKKENVAGLKEILKEYSLRRTKDLVCSNLPPIEQVIFYHNLTEQQKKLYVNILIKDYDAFKGNQPGFSLSNQVMHLRKAVVHPYLFPGEEPEPFEEGEHLVLASSKLLLLDSVLSHLISIGHKCLVFSQFATMLDIIQDYLNMRKWQYERLDGSMRAEERFQAIDNFERQGDANIFLLSTRAGGVGLTLTRADTVIFIDSDWNPQNDIQAMARCHRIGQTKAVRVIRFVARYTVEEYMHSKAKEKLRLTSSLMEGEEHTVMAAELAQIVRNGVARIAEQKADAGYDQELIQKVVGETDEKGQWMPLAEEDLVQDDELDLAGEEYFVFEGKRYRAEEKDTRAFEEIVTKGSKRKTIPAKVSPSSPSVKRKTRVSNLTQRWADYGYTSANLPLDEEEEEEDGESVVDPVFTTGSVTHPAIQDGARVIVHTVDNSGEFGMGGVFDALRELSEEIPTAYEKAKKMADVKLGDAHLIALPDQLFVVLAVVHRMSDRGVIVSSALDKALARICRFSKEKDASVHISRIGYGTNMNWYTIERKLKKYFSYRGVPLYVYYYRRKGFRRQPTSIDSSDNEERTRPEGVAIGERKETITRKRPRETKENVPRMQDYEEDEEVSSSDSSNSDSEYEIDQSDDGQSSDESFKGETSEEEEVEGEDGEEEDEEGGGGSEGKKTRDTTRRWKREERPKRNDKPVEQKSVVLKGGIFYVYGDDAQLKRSIVENGGILEPNDLYLYDVTHAIVADAERASARRILARLSVDAVIHPPAYIEHCLLAGQLL